VLTIREAIGHKDLRVPKDWLIGQEIPSDAELQRQHQVQQQAAWSAVKGIAKKIPRWRKSPLPTSEPLISFGQRAI
jgi:hypothetical protein